MKQSENKNDHEFYCQICDITCKNKYSLKRHTTTTRHKMKEWKPFEKKKCMICDICKIIFKSRSTAYRHKKTCKQKNTILDDEDKDIQDKIYKELVKMNKKSLGNTVNNQTINNNQKITINVFLDKYCGDAMSLTDFLDKLQVTLEDLDTTHKLGYVGGMSSIFIKNLKDLPIVQRPIHCSDSKRGQFYIKDEDKWEKESGEKIEKVIDSLQLKHIKTISEWEKANPNYLKDEQLLLKWNKMIHNIMGPYQTEDKHKNKKIIVKNVGDKVLIKDAMKDIDE